MSRFTLTKPLPSTRVTRDLVRSLETYIAQKTTALAGKTADEQALLASKRTTIKDDLGTEPLITIDEHAQNLFSDSTTEVEVEFRGAYKSNLEQLSIAIKFSDERIHSSVRISFEAPNAREVVVGIFDGLKRCIDTSPGRNSLFHPPAFWGGAIGALTFMVFMVAVWSWRFVPPVIAWALFALWLTLYLVWSVAPKFRPYTVFESDRANRRARGWDWLFKGLLGFLLFGTALTLMREKLAAWLQ